MQGIDVVYTHTVALIFVTNW